MLKFILGVFILYPGLAYSTVKPVILSVSEGVAYISLPNKTFVGEKTDWYLLRKNNSGGLTLATAKIFPYKWSKNECMGGEDLQVRIKTPKPDKNSFLLIGGMRLKPKALPGIFFSDAKALELNTSLEIKQNGVYVLNVTGSKEKSTNEPKLTNFVLELKKGNTHQSIYAPGHAITRPPNLHWAGDIDSDGKLDLIIDVGEFAETSDLTLFLSSYAGKKQLVVPVAHHLIEPC